MENGLLNHPMALLYSAHGKMIALEGKIEIQMKKNTDDKYNTAYWMIKNCIVESKKIPKAKLN